MVGGIAVPTMLGVTLHDVGLADFMCVHLRKKRVDRQVESTHRTCQTFGFVAAILSLLYFFRFCLKRPLHLHRLFSY